jgi:hypothetical protein
MKRVKTITVTDHNTGETNTTVEEKTFRVKSKNNKNPFYLMYPEFIDNLLKIKQHTDVKVYLKLVLIVQKETNLLSITDGKRKVITEELSISNSQLSTSFKNLKELKLLEGEKGEFRLLGYPVFKGYAEQRNSLMIKEAADKVKLIKQNEF